MGTARRHRGRHEVSQDGTTFPRETGALLRGAAPFVYPLPGGGAQMDYVG